MALFNNKNTFIEDPYSYFQKKYEEDLLKSDSVKRDSFERVASNPEKIKEEIDKQLEEARLTRREHVYKAMQMDPAFMVDPIEDYYKKLIPKDMLENLSDEEIEEIIAYYDPVTWAKKNLYRPYGGWTPRTSKSGFPYQAQLSRSKSKRIVVRAGRRIGKSMSLAVRVLHKAFTWRKTKTRGHYNIVIFTPNQTQINVIFKMFEQLLEGNPELLEMVGIESKTKGRIPTRKTPNYVLELTNGVTISGFVSGSTAIRGSAANLLILDEASFLTPIDTDSVISLINEDQDVELWVSSTPSGPKDYFYDRVNDPKFVSFYFPTNEYHPEWSIQMEEDFKSQLTSVGFVTEVLADFVADGQTVFQKQFVDRTLEEYKYANCIKKENWAYSIGVDWNDEKNGTQIVVLGYNLEEKLYRIVDRSSVSVVGWTQTKAIQEIVRLNELWRPKIIYTDYGFGAGQNERLHEIGSQSPAGSASRNLINSKAINFSSSVEIIDPWTKQKVKKPTKSYMINNAVRVFENNFIRIPKNDELLYSQLIGYSIERISPNGVPVYRKDPKAGDHILDALVLALFAFHMEFSTIAKPVLDNTTIFKTSSTFSIRKSTPAEEADRLLQLDKEREREEFLEANGVVEKGNPLKRRGDGVSSQMVSIARSQLYSKTIHSRTRRRL